MKVDATTQQYEYTNTSSGLEKYRTSKKLELISGCLGTESSDSGHFSDEDAKSFRTEKKETQSCVTANLRDTHQGITEKRRDNSDKDSETEELSNSDGEATEPYTFSSEDETDDGNSTDTEMAQPQEFDTSETFYTSESSLSEDNGDTNIISQIVYEESTDLSDGEEKISNAQHQSNKSTFGESSCIEKQIKMDNCAKKVAKFSKHANLSPGGSSDTASHCLQDKVSENFSNSKTLQKIESANPECIPITKILIQNGNSYSHNFSKSGVGQDKRFKCDDCGKSYSSEARHREHMLSHKDCLPFKCDRCSKGFLYLSDFKRHEKQRTCRRKSLTEGTIKSNNQRIKCDICGTKFKSEHTKKSHMKRTHSNLTVTNKSTNSLKRTHSNLTVTNKSTNSQNQSDNISLQSYHAPDKEESSLGKSIITFDVLEMQTTHGHTEQQHGLETADKFGRKVDFNADECKTSTRLIQNTTISDLSKEHADDQMKEHSTHGAETNENKSNFNFDKVGTLIKVDLNEKRSTAMTNERHQSPTKQASFECKICDIKFISKILLNDHIDRHKDEMDHEDNKDIASDESDGQEYQSIKGDNYEINERLSNNEIKDPLKEKGNSKAGCLQENKRKSSSHSDDNDVLSAKNDNPRVKRPRKEILDKKAEANSLNEQEEIQTPKDEVNDKTESTVIESSSDRNKGQTYREPGKNIQCEYCEKRFKDGKDLRVHTRVHTGYKPFTCTICNKRFTQSSNYHRHMRIHTRKEAEETGINLCIKGDYKCNVCGKVFGQPQQLSRHMVHHTGDTFRCDICGKEFIDQYCLTRHLIIHSDEKPYKCSYCAKTFNRKECLKLHERKHTGVPSSATSNADGITLHVCGICKKPFVSQYSLNLHMHKHTGEKPFACDLCGKRFSQKAQLNGHQLIHTGDTPYICEVCDESFNHRSLLRRHMVSHTNVFPHVCEVCGKGFRAKQEMEIHVAGHSGKEDHCCHVCGKKFVHQYLLDKHVRTAHKKQKCELCGIVFKSYNALRHHKSVLHRQKV